MSNQDIEKQTFREHLIATFQYVDPCDDDDDFRDDDFDFRVTPGQQTNSGQDRRRRKLRNSDSPSFGSTEHDLQDIILDMMRQTNKSAASLAKPLVDVNIDQEEYQRLIQEGENDDLDNLEPINSSSSVDLLSSSTTSSTKKG
jgi:hypothetical protein